MTHVHAHLGFDGAELGLEHEFPGGDHGGHGHDHDVGDPGGLGRVDAHGHEVGTCLCPGGHDVDRVDPGHRRGQRGRLACTGTAQKARQPKERSSGERPLWEGVGAVNTGTQSAHNIPRSAFTTSTPLSTASATAFSEAGSLAPARVAMPLIARA